ncbi:hypothetical protein PQA64_gp03 [Burkholderia phage PhiBP82.2]|nr:hypothetical protein PQA64_gp03 [Burkholderia phage PhiBP82.2]UKM53762.1 hypothetical protein PhiBP822_04 [Burkholderia phage PhiBP82.2]
MSRWCASRRHRPGERASFANSIALFIGRGDQVNSGSVRYGCRSHKSIV